jgi:hypothetical protein
MAVAACLAVYAGGVLVARQDDLWWELSVARQRWWSVLCLCVSAVIGFRAVSTVSAFPYLEAAYF